MGESLPNRYSAL